MFNAYTWDKPAKQSTFSRCFYILFLSCWFFWSGVTWWWALFYPPAGPSSRFIQQFPVSNEKIAHALSKAVFAAVGFPGSGTSQKFDALRSPIHREKLANLEKKRKRLSHSVLWPSEHE